MADGSTAAAWDAEYRRAGIPSSSRDAPSTVVAWALENWPWLDCGHGPRRALDVGCGTARNAAFLASKGVRVTGFDSSTAAIDAGRRRVLDAALDVDLVVHDLGSGLPVGDGEIDLVLDVFVYKHQIHPDARSRYRRELQRVLADKGRVLMSVAEPDDGYYGSCPPSPESAAAPHAVLDPSLGLSSVLFSLDELAAEMADVFRLEMAWRREQRGEMHGNEYVRRTLATLWRRHLE